MRPDFAGAEEFLPDRRTVPALRSAVQDCRGCDLWEEATQAVFGAGSRDPDLVLVGEQPGDSEDREGEPFVGPAGRVLRQALEEAGIQQEQVYVTNAVKHFRFTRPKGKRRIHQSPTRWQVAACEPWLLAELDALSPSGVVLLGGTAGKAVLGSSFKVETHRGHLLDLPGREEWCVATTHPSAVLRARDRRDEMLEGLVGDLVVAREHIA